VLIYVAFSSYRVLEERGRSRRPIFLTGLISFSCDRRRAPATAPCDA